MENCHMSDEAHCSGFEYSGREITVSEARETVFESSKGDDEGSVDLEMDDVNGIVKIRLNNPKIKNGINGKMMMDLQKIVDKLDEKWPEYKGVILCGADGNFCSGGDLNWAKRTGNPEMGYAMATYMGHILDKFKNLPMITAVYIEGFGALGGGAELTTACDYRLMCTGSKSTIIGFVHAKMGLVPAWGSTGRLISIIGSQKTMDLLLDSRPLVVDEAMAIGLVDDTVATLVDAVKWLSWKTRHDANVIRALKRTRLCHENGADRQAASLMERKIFAPLWGAPANREALIRRYKHIKTTPSLDNQQ